MTPGPAAAAAVSRSAADPEAIRLAQALSLFWRSRTWGTREWVGGEWEEPLGFEVAHVLDLALERMYFERLVGRVWPWVFALLPCLHPHPRLTELTIVVTFCKLIDLHLDVGGRCMCWGNGVKGYGRRKVEVGPTLAASCAGGTFEYRPVAWGPPYPIVTTLPPDHEWDAFRESIRGRVRPPPLVVVRTVWSDAWAIAEVCGEFALRRVCALLQATSPHAPHANSRAVL
jgi:hypothetical protein